MSTNKREDMITMAAGAIDSSLSLGIHKDNEVAISEAMAVGVLADMVLNSIHRVLL